MEAEQQWRMSVNLARGRSAFPDEVIRRICQWMPTQRDINDLALVSRQFRRVANAVLWEKPVFHNAEAFVKFFASITDHADLRLRVQHLTLCRPDVAFASNGSAASFYSTDDTHTDKTMADAEHAFLFLPLSFANSERHNHMQQTDLADPHNILSLAQTCERLRFLRIYGWNMTRRDLDQLADHCSELQVLHIIGSDAQVWSGRHAPMPRLLPRLTGLVLDGTCYLRHEKVSETIATSCYSLSKLQLSLAEVTNANILWTLTNHPDRVITNLCDFVLTDAQPLVDDHVDRVVRAFPHLRRLCLEGSTRLTVDAVRSVVIHCRKIEHLEIRQAANTPLHMPYSTPDWALKRPAATLNTLLLDHVPLDDAAADNISRYCPALRKIGLRAIGDQLSPELLTRLITSYPFLRHLSVSHTPALDADVLSQLPTERMFTLFIENAGPLDVDDVYALCCRATPDLRCVVLDGYPALAPMADYGKRSNTAHSRIILDEQAMDAIKESPDFKILPEDRTVTGYQLDLLAKEIQMPLNQLVELLDSLPMAPDTPYSSRRSSEGKLVKKKKKKRRDKKKGRNLIFSTPPFF
ncbi:hypothetical protein BC940DRAFT_180061 [Gongronella butleri]|nr:hypothetical protein BC940DRAFT_180061 [Gongronella butleri]